LTTVVHFSSAHSGDDTRIFHKELQSLSKSGYDCHYVVFDDGESGVKDEVTVSYLGDRPSKADRWKDIATLYRAVADLDPDVAHFHDIELIPVGVWLKHRTDARVVYDAHENYPHLIHDRDWIPDPLRPILDRTVPTAEAKAAEYFDGVIAATEWIEASLRDRGVSDVRTVHNFPKTTGIQFDTDGPTYDTITLVYAGYLSDIRGLSQMIDVVAELRSRGRSVDLVCFGKFVDESVDRSARSLCRELGVASAVEFPGYVAYDRLFSHLAAADVGLALLDVDHYKGGIPTKLFEYMYSGLPIVVTEIQAAESYVSEEWGLTVPENATQVQADAIEQLLDDPEWRSEMGRAGRKAVEEKYSWEAEEDRLLELYEDVLADK